DPDARVAARGQPPGDRARDLGQRAAGFRHPAQPPVQPAQDDRQAVRQAAAAHRAERRLPHRGHRAAAGLRAVARAVHMPQGLPRKLRFAFLMQVAMASLVIIAGTWVAVHYARQHIAAGALQEEADYFWAQRALDPAWAPPNEARLRGYYVSDGGSAAQLPPDLRPLEPGLHRLEKWLVLVDRRDDG